MQNGSPAVTGRRVGARVALASIALLLAVATSCSSAGPRDPSSPLRQHPSPLLVDGDLELARRYAPWILHEVHPTKGRQDLPTRADFDGNLRGDDDWENFELFELPPVVYYSVVGTETHWFLTYHLFHPRDWTLVDLGLNLTHENDGENLQVVVARTSGRVVLLFTQAHFCGRAWADEGSGFGSGREEVSSPLVLVDEEGRPSREGSHPVVVVEWGGHGIDALAGRADDVALDEHGRATFDGHGLVFRPAREGEGIAEPPLDAVDRVPYALGSTIATFWPGVRDGSLLGEHGLFDGTLRLATPELVVDVPRYYEADRFSGPLGSDRGISPFAVDFRFGEGEVGALLFDPARRYAGCLSVPSPWSTRYVDFPFTILRR